MKNTLHLSISTIILMVLVTMTGCKKDNDSKNELNKKVLLTSHIWKFNDLSSTSTDSNIQLAVSLIKALKGNASINFTTGGTYTMSLLAGSDNGSWEFNAGETSIIMDNGTAYESEEIIVQLTSNILEFKENVQDADLGNFNVTFKWVK